ncbi:MAG: hypothetical protein AAF711_08840 [Planctomycetota bacterium]
MSFYPPCPDRYPAIELAYKALRIGGTAPAILNAANEAAVQAFLERHIAFGRIVELAAAALDAIQPQSADTLTTILEADRATRIYVRDQLAEYVAADEQTNTLPHTGR